MKRIAVLLLLSSALVACSADNETNSKTEADIQLEDIKTDDSDVPDNEIQNTDNENKDTEEKQSHEGIEEVDEELEDIQKKETLEESEAAEKNTVPQNEIDKNIITTTPEKKEKNETEKETQESKTNEDVKIDVSKGVDHKIDNDLTEEENAINAVRAYLGIDEQSRTKVVLDHENGSKFIVHVYDVVEMGGGFHNATVGWYEYNPDTKQVEPTF